MNNKNKICHITSVHQRKDTRIFLKECQSIAKGGYNVNFIVADNKGYDTADGIKIYDVGKKTARLKRIIITVWKVYKKALEIDADIYHFHDPELLCVGLLLKFKKKKVIYDAHEDVPRQIFGKPYLKKWQKLIVSKSFEIFENFASKRFDHIITATPFIRDRFLKINKNTIDINNFTKINELKINIAWKDKKNEICYIGGITKNRGINELIDAMELVDTKLNLAGVFVPKSLRKKISSQKGWSKVNELGFVEKDKIIQILADSKIGIVTLHPLINYLDSLPMKMFDYMAAGIPVIASDFPLWKEIIEGNNCGICVNPLNPEEIANAIKYLLTHPKEAEHMGINGRNAVNKKYNWSSEEKKLIKIYERVNIGLQCHKNT